MLIRKVIATVFLCALAVHALAAQDWNPDRRWRGRDGLQIRVGRDYYLPADQIATWPVVVIAGSATIEGRVEQDIVVIGGPVRIGPGAQVRADIVAVGGEVRVADTAEVTGEIHDVGVLWPDIRFALGEWFWGVDRGWWAALALAGTMFRFTLTIFLASLLALVAPAWIRRMQDRVSDAPLAAGFIGLATEVLMLPAFVIVIAGLVLTIVGIPLLLLVPFVGLALLVSWIAGFAGVAAFLGSRLRAGSRAAMDSTVVDVAWGVTLLFILPFVSNLVALASWSFSPISNAFGVAGFVLEYLAWTVGLGAALLAPLHRRWQVGPPPVPSAASASA